MAPCQTGYDRTDLAKGRSGPFGRSGHRLADLADCRGVALHQATSDPHSGTGSIDRRAENGLIRLHHDAALAMRFRGIFRSRDIGKLDVWLDDTQASGIYTIGRFVRTLRQDIAAVRNVITEIWSNGQVEGQINRLKTLKRATH